MVIVYRATHAQECMERALVLTAMGIDHAVRRDWWGWCLQVEGDTVSDATKQLDLYEQENRAAAAPLTLTRWPLDNKISIFASDAFGSITGGSMIGGAATTSTGRKVAAGSSTAVALKRGSRSHLNTRFAFTS